jgi:NAD dependent epimerase/dehydratase family enzyme
MALPFKLFVGGKVGSGKQGISWIHLDDAASALIACIDDESMPQKVNICSPNPASSLEVAAAIGKALHRPNWLPAVSVGLKALFGEGATPILTGQFAVPSVLSQRGFEFRHPDLTEAVASSL